MENSNNTFRRKGDLGLPFVFGLLAIATALGWVVFKNYATSEKEIVASLQNTQENSKLLTIEQCAQNNIKWFQTCGAIQQLCSDSVGRMMGICLMAGDKKQDCAVYGREIYGYNFGATQCKPYLHSKNLKKACADTWQTIADYCKKVQANAIPK